MRQNGADSLAFETIVASGPQRCATPSPPTDRELQIGDNITIDMGAKRDGYYSDMTRRFSSVTNRMHFWDVAAIWYWKHSKTHWTNMRADMKGNEVDALARDIIEAAGFADEFGHGLGAWRRVGNPRVAAAGKKTETNTLPVNAIVTVEPGIYFVRLGRRAH